MEAVSRATNERKMSADAGLQDLGSLVRLQGRTAFGSGGPKDCDPENKIEIIELEEKAQRRTGNWAKATKRMMAPLWPQKEKRREEAGAEEGKRQRTEGDGRREISTAKHQWQLAGPRLFLYGGLRSVYGLITLVPTFNSYLLIIRCFPPS